MTRSTTGRWTLPTPRTFGVAALLAFGASAGFAGEAKMYVNNFTVFSDNQLVWSDPYQSFDATAENGGGLFGADADHYDSSDYGFTSTAAFTSRALATGQSLFSPQTFYVLAQTTANPAGQANPVGTPPNRAFSSALQSGSFTLLDGTTGLATSGIVTFAVDFTLEVSAPGGNPLDNYAQAFANFSAFNDNGTNGNSFSSQLSSYELPGSVGLFNGTFNVSVNLASGEFGFYTLDGSAVSLSVAAVPEPGEWALMGAGLFAMAAYVRRRRAKVPAV